MDRGRLTESTRASGRLTDFIRGSGRTNLLRGAWGQEPRHHQSNSGSAPPLDPFDLKGRLDCREREGDEQD